jgi:hypothetical protein
LNTLAKQAATTESNADHYDLLKANSNTNPLPSFLRALAADDILE